MLFFSYLLLFVFPLNLAWQHYLFYFQKAIPVDLKILTYNVQGIGGISKRTDVFDYLQNMNFDIYCLQETHFKDEDEILIRTH